VETSGEGGAHFRDPITEPETSTQKTTQEKRLTKKQPGNLKGKKRWGGLTKKGTKKPQEGENEMVYKGTAQ